MSGRRRAELCDQRLRYGVKDYLSRQMLARVPLLCLARRHATVVLLGQSRRTAPGAELLTVVVMEGDPVVVSEMVPLAEPTGTMTLITREVLATMVALGPPPNVTAVADRKSVV